MDPIRYGLRLALLGALFGSGCNRAAPPPPSPPASPFRPVADVKQLMSAVLEPAAEIYWDAVGTIVDKRGTTEIEPKTDDEWIAVRNSAYVVAESGNLLMMDTRARDKGDWMTLSQALVEVGQRAIRAAESRNKSAVFDAGAEVYEACVACHAKYALSAMRPNAGRPGS
jgi:hypothetical protein